MLLSSSYFDVPLRPRVWKQYTYARDGIFRSLRGTARAKYYSYTYNINMFYSSRTFIFTEV